jgi:cellobiose phosphorylase
MIAGRDAPTHSEAKNSWLTSAAAWNYVTITQWILGIRATLHGLQIGPVIPAQWDGFEATRRYRGAVYHISVRNPKHIGRGVKSLRVDGQEIEGSTVPVLGAGEHKVEVLLGL